MGDLRPRKDGDILENVPDIKVDYSDHIWALLWLDEWMRQLHLSCMTLFFVAGFGSDCCFYVFLWCIALFRLLQTDPSFSVGIGDALSYSEAAANMVRLHFIRLTVCIRTSIVNLGFTARFWLSYIQRSVCTTGLLFFRTGSSPCGCSIDVYSDANRFLSDRIAVIVYLLL